MYLLHDNYRNDFALFFSLQLSQWINKNLTFHKEKYNIYTVQRKEIVCKAAEIYENFNDILISAFIVFFSLNVSVTIKNGTLDDN